MRRWFLVFALVSPLACGDRGSPSTRAARPAPEAEPASEPETPPAPAADEPPAAIADEITFTVDGQDRRLAIRDKTQATINRLVTPPAVAIVARADEGSETLMLKLGGVDLDRAVLPLQLRGSSAFFTYVDPEGAKTTGRLEGADDHLTIDAWDPASGRLRGRFAFTLASNTVRGSLDVALHDPFQH